MARTVTDVATGWAASRSVAGKGKRRVTAALDEIRRTLTPAGNFT